MPWQFAADRPIYSQLVDYLSIFIITGKYQAGERLPSVRDLAAEAKVNPNTMQRALAELENMQLVYSERTSGRFVTDDKEMIQTTKEMLALKRIEQFYADMARLGIGWQQALSMAATGKELKT
ncbi:MAG: GntR family transcriptional regulator [Firmicutes bacterium]|nr:GntR family transcriptional regulator [Bacillota bacterium]